MVSFDSVKIYALLNNAWVDLSGDVRGISSLGGRWGIFGYSPSDILAGTGEFRFALSNTSGKYYPDGSSPLSGWGAGVKVKVVFTYSSVPYIRFVGYIPKDGIRLRVGQIANESYVEVTALDWMKFAVETPIKSPSIEEDKTADEAITTLLSKVPISVVSDLDTGTYTFPAVFDGTGKNTTAYSEFARLAYSESPGRIYLIKKRESGEELVFENSTARDAPTQKSTYTLTPHFWLNEAGDYWLNESGGYWLNDSPTEADAIAVTLDSDIDALGTEYGSNIINRAIATAHPKRVDDELQILYRLPNPVFIADGDTVTLKGRYVDPSGGGTQINAIVESMQTPTEPETADPYRMLLCHFTTNVSDSTGRHTVTANDVTVEDDVYIDVGPDPDVQRISGNILGPYAIFGGYANYNLSVASSDDFEFGSGAFTIGWYENIIETTSGDSTIARDGTTTYAPWVLGKSDGTNKLIYMSSNGSSWDIANGKSLGQMQRGRWVHYEVSRDEDGWFYAFADGVLTDKWYSALSFPANSNALSVGKAQGANYIFAGIDELFIDKGRALHVTDFDPPRRNLSHLLDGDYWLNTAKNASGTDLTSGLVVEAIYGPDEVSYTLTNNSGSDGYAYVQARGLGLYNYDQIEEAVEDADSIAANGYQVLSVNQYYQQNLDAGITWITAIVTAEKDARTVLRSISFWANRTENNMLRFLQCDVGDLIRVTVSAPGIDGYYHIQNVGFEIKTVDLVYVTWGLVEGNAP